MDRATIEQGVIAAAKETYPDAGEITLESTYEALGNHSSKLLRMSMFIDEALDTDEAVDLDDLMEHVTLNDTVELLVKNLA